MRRLEKILSFITACGTLADIGCDHGKLSKAVLDLNLAKKVYASDISKASLEKAKLLIGGDARAEFFTGDGLKALPSLPDTAIIAGMGGDEIIAILSGFTVNTLILQPQTKVSKVRRYLCANGYEITHDALTEERGRLYTVIKAVYGGGEYAIDETQAEYGMFYKDKDPLLKVRLERERQKLKAYAPTDGNMKKLILLSEAEKWQL